MLTPKQRIITAQELQKNYQLLEMSEDQVLSDLSFTKGQLHEALTMSDCTNGYDVWKLRDYLVHQLQKQGKKVYEFSVLKENRWYHY